MNTTMMKIGLIAATVMGASLAFSPLAAAGTPSTALKASDLHGHIASTDRSVIVIAQAIAPIGVKLRGDGSIDDSQPGHSGVSSNSRDTVNGVKLRGDGSIDDSQPRHSGVSSNSRDTVNGVKLRGDGSIDDNSRGRSHIERGERAERAERAERPERAERAERAERPEKAERPERAERPEKAG